MPIYEASFPAAAITVDQDTTVVVAPFDGVVNRVSIIPEDAATGDDTNNRVFTLVNRGQAGIGTTVIATLSLDTGVDLVAHDEIDFELSAVAGALNVVQGDVLVLDEVTPGSGLASGGGLIRIDISPSYA